MGKAFDVDEVLVAGKVLVEGKDMEGKVLAEGMEDMEDKALEGDMGDTCGGNFHSFIITPFLLYFII